ncbi:hypothetical protein NMY22_g18901 [Coprinellus aureogranulatus]|nr:hypothetical protein NMY22_g18901 [Coprinellus aureogranulatus]
MDMSTISYRIARIAVICHCAPVLQRLPSAIQSILHEMSKDDILQAAVEGAVVRVEKKSKKSKDKKRERKEENAVDEVEEKRLGMDAAGKEKEKKRRKDKKEKATPKDEATMDVDEGKSTSPLLLCLYHQFSPAESSTLEKAESTARESKKDKKRKRKEAELEGRSAESDSKKDKKKRRKEEKAASTTSSSASAEASTCSSKAASPAKATITFTSTRDAEEFMTKHNITITLSESDPTPVSPVVSFSQLTSLPNALMEAFKTFKEPSPIQACTWPPALAGKDVVGIAETGSGKTLAFGIPALNALINSPTSSSSSNITTLIVAPTRELAIQTHDALSALGKPFGIASVAIFGGVPKEGQIKMLKASMKKGSDGLLTRIVVGTPGRILDLMNDGALDLSGVNYLVLDEADRMLDKGFENDIRRIIEATKPMKERQTMMFSATWPESVRRLAGTFQRDPVRVTVGSDDLTANSRVEQIVEVFDDARSKDQRLQGHLKKVLPNKKPSGGYDENRVLVFALYKKEASRVEQNLKYNGYAVGALHGDMSQTARMDALEKFKSGVTNLLVATDVAARGLDIPNVNAVINYTFPLTIEDYIHRIGRTGAS